MTESILKQFISKFINGIGFGLGMGISFHILKINRQITISDNNIKKGSN